MHGPSSTYQSAVCVRGGCRILRQMPAHGACGVSSPSPSDKIELLDGKLWQEDTEFEVACGTKSTSLGNSA